MFVEADDNVKRAHIIAIKVERRSGALRARRGLQL